MFDMRLCLTRNNSGNGVVHEKIARAYVTVHCESVLQHIIKLTAAAAESLIYRT